MSKFIINQISSSNAENIKLNDCPQIPIVLAVPGPISIRNVSSPYTLTTGDKKGI
jgi:hypothetical protein